MQQFRPLPRFEKIEEAVPVETPPTATTDPIPAITDSLSEVSLETSTGPIVSKHTTARIPVILFTGPSPTSDTSQLAALIKKSASTTRLPTLNSALQTTGPTPRLVVIHPEKKRKAVSLKHLNPRTRQAVVLVMTLGILIGTLVTLAPLSDDQNGSFFSNIGNWIHSAQIDWQVQAHQGDVNIPPAALNGQGLPYMQIPNSPYVHIAEQDAISAGISPVYFVRQINQESGFNPQAVSVTNAEGIAQFEPYTASGLGIDPWDPVQALRGAARLMANYYHQYGDYAKALGAYNAGSGAVQGAEYSCGRNWLSCMPGQSQDYVYRIMGT